MKNKKTLVISSLLGIMLALGIGFIPIKANGEERSQETTG